MSSSNSASKVFVGALQLHIPDFVILLSCTDIKTFIISGYVTRRFRLSGRFPSMSYTKAMRHEEDTYIDSLLNGRIPERSQSVIYDGDASGIFVEGQDNVIRRGDRMRITNLIDDSNLTFTYRRPHSWHLWQHLQDTIFDVRYDDLPSQSIQISPMGERMSVAEYERHLYGKGDGKAFWVQAFQEAVTKRSLFGFSPEVVDTLNCLSLIYSIFGELGMAEQSLEDAWQICEQINQSSVELFTTMGLLASAFIEQGIVDKAKALYDRAITRSRTTLGKDHPCTLANLRALSLLLAQREEDAKVLRLIEDFFAACSVDEAESDTTNFDLFRDIGALYMDQGRLDSAEKMYSRALAGYERAFGSEHPSTLDSTNNLGLLYCEQGRWEEAEQLFVLMMETRKTKLGAGHPSTLTSMANLASTYWNQGRWAEAEQLEVQVMEMSKMKLGADHSDTLTSMANLASTYWNQGRWVEAEQLEVQVMEMSKMKLGEDHPDTLTSMNNLATTYMNQGRWTKAEQLEVQVLETRKTKLGTDHPDTLTSMANLASTYWNQGRWAEAEQLNVQVMETRKTKLGVDHPSTLTSMNNLASTYRNQGRWAEAEQLNVQVIETRKTKLGVDHPSTLTSMANLASTYWNQGRWTEAEQLQIQVLKIYETKLGADHPNTLTSIANLASTYRNQGRLQEAGQLEVQVLNTCKTKLGADHPDTLTSMNNLAFTWKELGRDAEAVQLMTECVQGRTRTLGAIHPDSISSNEVLRAWTSKRLEISADTTAGLDVT